MVNSTTVSSFSVSSTSRESIVLGGVRERHRLGLGGDKILRTMTRGELLSTLTSAVLPSSFNGERQKRCRFSFCFALHRTGKKFSVYLHVKASNAVKRGRTVNSSFQKVKKISPFKLHMRAKIAKRTQTSQHGL